VHAEWLRTAANESCTPYSIKKPPDDVVLELAGYVYDLLGALVQAVPDDACESDFFCGCLPIGSTFEGEQRLLAAFDQCSHAQPFEFNLDLHSLPEWLVLCGPAIQCTLEACNHTGWMFVGVKQKDWPCGHQTALYVEPTSVTFFDPSLFLGTNGKTILQLLSTIPAWGHRRIHIVDGNLDNPLSENIQHYFRNPNIEDPYNLDGCCTTITMLLIWLCLRFGCRQPQIMVDAMRYAMAVKRTHLPQDQLHQFLVKLRAWQDTVLLTNNIDNVRDIAGLRADPYQKHCLFMQYRNVTTFCQNPCQDGWVWCREHVPRRSQENRSHPDDALYSRLKVRPLMDVVYSVVPRGTLGLGAVAYIQGRHDSSEWACALDPFRESLRRVRMNLGPQLGVIRFTGFTNHTSVLPHMQEVLDVMQPLWCLSNVLDVAVIEVDALLPDSQDVQISLARTVTKSILGSVPVNQWKFSLVFAHGLLTYVSLDMGTFEGKEHFDSSLGDIQKYLRDEIYKPCVHISIRTPQQLSWVLARIHNPVLMQCLSIVFHVDDSDIQTEALWTILQRRTESLSMGTEMDISQVLPQGMKPSTREGCDTYLAMGTSRPHGTVYTQGSGTRRFYVDTKLYRKARVGLEMRGIMMHALSSPPSQLQTPLLFAPIPIRLVFPIP
jgi:hypothetical protein